jgi:Ni/Co efflux regulator RcnB
MVLPNRMEPNMNSKAVVSAIMAMSLTTAGFAFAQGQGDNYNRGRNDQAQRGGQQERRDTAARQPNRGDNRSRANNNGYQARDEQGAGPNHDFRRGGRLPAEYRHRQYVVNDWRGHNLSAPPRGYHWVQAGNDYVLAAVATGIITQLLLNH